MKKLLFIIPILCLVAIAETVISPNMNLPVPVVGTTPGPTWANNINSCMSAIDQHDHTPGKGVPISSDAIDITSSLSLNNNSLTSTKAVTFSSQTSFSTNQSVYVINPDLYYNDGNGNTIRITQSGSVAGASGTITGLPSGTASASYQSVGGTFQFQSATNTPANITGASISIAQQTATPNSITLKSPNSLAASYNVTFPTSVPSYTSLLAMSTSGVLSTVPYKAPTLQKFASGSGTYTLPTGPSPLYLIIKMVGGGGGGGSGGGAGSGSSGGDTTFGTSLLTAGGGAGGTYAGANPNGAAGGAATVNSPAVGIGVSGGGSGAGQDVANASGGMGGSSCLGGAGLSVEKNQDGSAGVAGTGGGGSGAAPSGGGTAAGGGSGACIEAMITSPSSSYAYAVGAGGAGGATGGAFTGGAGGAGVIAVYEYYQ